MYAVYVCMGMCEDVCVYSYNIRKLRLQVLKNTIVVA